MVSVPVAPPAVKTVELPWMGLTVPSEFVADQLYWTVLGQGPPVQAGVAAKTALDPTCRVSEEGVRVTEANAGVTVRKVVAFALCPAVSFA